jgi:PAS domain S-box-containing protein
MSNLNSLHHQFFNKTSERIYFRDKDRKLTWANPSFFCDLASEDVSQLIGTTLAEIELESLIADTLGEVEGAVYENHESQTRSHLRGSMGNSNVTIFVECHPVHSEDGVFAGVVGQYRIEEVSKYLGYEKILIDSLMKNTQDLIYFKDRNSKFTRVSESMIPRLGAKSIEDIIGKSDFDFWDMECAQGFFDDEQRIIDTGESISVQCEEELRVDGITSWVVSSKMPLYDENNEVIGTFGISKDVTELKQTELRLDQTHQELLEASRQAGMAEIATNVIHNVGNVLNSINVSIATGRDLTKNQDLSHLRKAADLLEENASNSGYLLNDKKGKILPGFIKLSAQTLENTREKLLAEFDNLKKHLTHVKTVVSMQQEYAGARNILKELKVSSLVEDAIQIGEGSLQQSGVGVITCFEENVEATVEKHKVLQILINLIRNAKHACEDAEDGREKEIKITVDTPTDDFFTIEIADNGVGISSENLTCIFNHGFTTKEQGKGFGLHSSANAAKEMGGSLIATSDGIGFGASFVLTLPIKPKVRKQTSTKSISDTTVDQMLPPEVAAALL